MTNDLELISDSQIVLAPLLEGKPLVLYDKRSRQPVFISPLSSFRVFADPAYLVIGTPKGNTKIMDVRNIKLNDLHFAGMNMRSAKVLRDGLEKTFHVSKQGEKNGNKAAKEEYTATSNKRRKRHKKKSST